MTSNVYFNFKHLSHRNIQIKTHYSSWWWFVCTTKLYQTLRTQSMSVTSLFKHKHRQHHKQLDKTLFCCRRRRCCPQNNLISRHGETFLKKVFAFVLHPFSLSKRQFGNFFQLGTILLIWQSPAVFTRPFVRSWLGPLKSLLSFRWRPLLIKRWVFILCHKFTVSNRLSV